MGISRHWRGKSEEMEVYRRRLMATGNRIALFSYIETANRLYKSVLQRFGIDAISAAVFYAY